MFKTAKTITDQGYNVVYEVNSAGKVTKAPKLYICPTCLEASAKHTSNEALQRKAAKHVVMGINGDTKVALCSKCGWVKTNGDSVEKPTYEEITNYDDSTKVLPMNCTVQDVQAASIPTIGKSYREGPNYNFEIKRAIMNRIV